MVHPILMKVGPTRVVISHINTIEVFTTAAYSRIPAMLEWYIW